jgi:hypothetical protein
MSSLVDWRATIRLSEEYYTNRRELDSQALMAIGLLEAMDKGLSHGRQR